MGADAGAGSPADDGDMVSDNVAPSDATEVDPAAVKDPDDWTTGDEPITAAQSSYLKTLAQDAGVEIDTGGMSKAEASAKITELQAESPRVDEQATSAPAQAASAEG